MVESATAIQRLAPRKLDPHSWFMSTESAKRSCSLKILKRRSHRRDAVRAYMVERLHFRQGAGRRTMTPHCGKSDLGEDPSVSVALQWSLSPEPSAKVSLHFLLLGGLFAITLHIPTEVLFHLSEWDRP